MEHAIRQAWEFGDPAYVFPGSGLCSELDGSAIRGALGFRPAPGRGASVCELIWIGNTKGVDWPGLIERVTTQARKGKYTFALVASDAELPVGLEEALRSAGFTGSPLARALAPDAPKHLQPYLDWDGRLLRLSAGKRSETINSELLKHLASRLPAEGTYSEKEMNETLRRLSLLEDYVTLRRDLVDRGHLARTSDGKRYWKPEP